MSDSEQYESVRKSKLKFKKVEKKKRKKIEENVEHETVTKKTKAEIAFKEMKEKNPTQRILDKASKTHKERVEEFNRHLDSLTEHFDIPKVSWTK